MKMTWIQSFLSAGVKALPCAVLLTAALAASPVQAAGEVLSLNFNSGSGSVSGSAGLHNVGGWNNYSAASADLASLQMWDGEATFENVKVTGSYKSANNWSYDASTNFMKGYLDDGAHDGVNGPTITLSGIPFSQYDVIVYAGTDTGSAKFKPIQINGSYYAGSATESTLGYATLVEAVNKDSATWGATSTGTPVYGTNALRVNGLTGTLTIQGGSNGNNARGGISAIQVINTGTLGTYTTTGHVVMDYAYPIIFRGTNDATWDTVANWYTLETTVAGSEKTDNWTAWSPTVNGKAPGLSGSNAWGATLVDGSLMASSITVNGDGYKKVNVAANYEGWASLVGIANNVHVEMANLVKLQADSDWRIDETSKLTINAFDDGNKGGTHNLYCYAEEGVVFTPNCGIAFNYYLGKKGSVIYGGALSGTQTIKAIELDLGDSSKDGVEVKMRKLIGFGSSSATLNTDGATVTGVKDDSVAATVTAKSVPVNVGDYTFVTEADGLYVKYMAYGSVTYTTVSATTTGDATLSSLNLEEGATKIVEITLPDGATLTIDEAATFHQLVILCEGSATVTASGQAQNSHNLTNISVLDCSGITGTATYAESGYYSAIPFEKLVGVDVVKKTGESAWTPNATVVAKMGDNDLYIANGSFSVNHGNLLANVGMITVDGTSATFANTVNDPLNRSETYADGVTLKNGGTITSTKHMRLPETLTVSGANSTISVNGVNDNGWRSISLRKVVLEENATALFTRSAEMATTTTAGYHLWNSEFTIGANATLTIDAPLLKGCNGNGQQDGITGLRKLGSGELIVTAPVSGHQLPADTVIAIDAGVLTLRPAGTTYDFGQASITIANGATFRVTGSNAIALTQTISGQGQILADGTTVDLTSATVTGCSVSMANGGAVLLAVEQVGTFTVPAGCTLKIKTTSYNGETLTGITLADDTAKVVFVLPNGREINAVVTTEEGVTTVTLPSQKAFVWTPAVDNNWSTVGNWVTEGQPMTAAPTPEELTQWPVIIELPTDTTLNMDVAANVLDLTVYTIDESTHVLTVAGENVLTIGGLVADDKVIVAGQMTINGGTAEAPIEVRNVLEVTGSLKTTGVLTCSAANTIPASGTLEVVSGETTFNLASTGLSGTFKVASGATLKNGTNDGPNYNGAPTLDIAGTLEVTGTARWSLPTNTTTILREGALLKGVGGSGYNYAYDWFAGDSITVEGNATIEGNVGVHTGGELTFDVASGKVLTLSGKFDGSVWGDASSRLRAAGAGTVKITGTTNTYTGGTTIDAGATIEANTIDNFPTSGNINVAGRVRFVPAANLDQHATTAYGTADAPRLVGTGVVEFAGDGYYVLPAGFTTPLAFENNRAGGIVVSGYPGITIGTLSGTGYFRSDYSDPVEGNRGDATKARTITVTQREASEFKGYVDGHVKADQPSRALTLLVTKADDVAEGIDTTLTITNTNAARTTASKLSVAEGMIVKLMGSWTQAVTGAGTVQLPTRTIENFVLGGFGDAETTLEIPAGATVSGTFNNATWTVAAKVKLDGALNLTNGYRDGRYTFTGPWTGSGALNLSNNGTGSPSDAIRIVGDISGFMGDLSIASVRAITFCGANTAANQKYAGKILVHADYAYPIKVNGTWTAPVQMDAGTLTGTGTIAGALTLASGVTVDAIAGAVSVDTLEALPTSLTVKASMVPMLAADRVDIIKAKNMPADLANTIVTLVVNGENMGAAYDLVTTEADANGYKTLQLKAQIAATVYEVAAADYSSLSAALNAGMAGEGPFADGATSPMSMVINFGDVVDGVATPGTFVFDAPVEFVKVLVRGTNGGTITATTDVMMTDLEIADGVACTMDATVVEQAARIAINEGAVCTLSYNGTEEIVISAVISGAGQLVAQGGEGAGAIKLSGANTYTGGTTIAANAIVKMGAASALGTGAIDGEGTLYYVPTMTGTVPTAPTLATTWVGTLILSDIEQFTNMNLKAFGTDNSTIGLKNVGAATANNFLNEPQTIASKINLLGDFSISNGNGGWNVVFANAITGSGTFLFRQGGTGNPTDAYYFTGDLSGYTGTLRFLGPANRRIVLGSANESDEVANQITIAGAVTWNGTMEAAGTIKVTANGVLGGEGTLSGAVAFAENATLKASATKALTLAAGATLSLPSTLNVVFDEGTPLAMGTPIVVLNRVDTSALSIAGTTAIVKIGNTVVEDAVLSVSATGDLVVQIPAAFEAVVPAGETAWDDLVWTVNGETVETVPGVVDNVILKPENADAVVTCTTAPLAVRALEATAPVAIRFTRDCITQEVYESIPTTVTLVTTEAGLDEQVSVQLASLKYGAMVAITKDALSAVAQLTLPDSAATGEINTERSQVISISFSDNASHQIGDADVTGLAGYEAIGTNWTRINGTRNGTNENLFAVSLAEVKQAGGEQITLSGALSFTVGNTYWRAASSQFPILKGYADDGGTTSLTVNLPAELASLGYTVIIYASADTPNAQFAPYTVNDTKYTFADGQTKPGETAWGDTGANNSSASTLEEGVNVLVVKNQTATTLTLSENGWWSNGSGLRGGIAGVQIVFEVLKYNLVSSVTATVSAATADTVVAWTDLAWVDDDGAPAAAPTANTPATIVFESDATLDLAGATAQQVQVLGYNHRVRFVPESIPSTVPFVFSEDTLYRLASANDTLPENTLRTPGTLRYEYAYDASTTPYVTVADTTSDFVAGFTGSFTANGGNIRFSDGVVSLTGCAGAEQQTGIIFAGTSRTTVAGEMRFGNADVLFADTAVVTTPKFSMADGQGYISTATMKDRAQLVVTGNGNDIVNGQTGGLSLVLAHWNATASLTIRDNAKLIAQDAVFNLSVDGTSTLTVEDDAEVRVKGLAYHNTNQNTSTVNLNGGSILIGEAGIRHLRGATPLLTLNFNGGTIGALNGSVTLGADAATAIASLTGMPVFESSANATLVLAQDEPFLATGEVTNRAGTLQVGDTTLTTLTVEGGILKVTGTVEVATLTAATAAKVTFDGGLLVVGTCDFADSVVLEIPLTNRLSDGGYIRMSNGAALPDLSGTILSLVLNETRADADKVLPEVPVVLGTYAEGDEPTVKGFGLINNTNNAIAESELVLQQGDLGAGLYVLLSGNEVLKRHNVELNQTAAGTGYTLTQTVADAYPYYYFTATVEGARLVVPAAGVAVSHPTFSGATTRIVVSGDKMVTPLVANHVSIATNLVFDLSAWKAVLPNFVRGAVRDVPVSFCLMSGGVTQAAGVTYAVELGDFELPAGFTSSVEATKDGLYWVVSANRPAHTVSVNFTNAATPLVAPPAKAGVYPTAVSAWNDLNAVYSSSNLKVTDFGGEPSSTATAVDGADNTRLLVYTSKVNTLASAPTSMLKVWLSDSTEQTLTVQNVPFEAYRVALIFANDLEAAAYAPIQVGEGTYAMDGEGYTRRDITTYTVKHANTGLVTLEVAGDEAWGSTDLPEAAEPVVAGVNALVTDVLTASEVKITLPAAVYGRRYAGLAALQIVEAPVVEAVAEPASFAYTFTADGDYALADLDLTSEEGTTAWVSATQHNLTLTSDYDVTVTLPLEFVADAITLAGSGKVTLKMENNGGALFNRLDASALTGDLTMHIVCVDVAFSAPVGVTTFEKAFNNNGQPYTIAEGATLVLGEAFPSTTNMEPDLFSTATVDLTIAPASKGTLRRNYAVEQNRPGESGYAWDITLAYKNAVFGSSAYWQPDLLVEEGDNIVVNSNNVWVTGNTTRRTFTYRQTGGSFVTGDTTNNNNGFLCSPAGNTALVNGNFLISGGRLHTAALLAWDAQAQVSVAVTNTGRLELWNKFHAQSGASMTATISQGGTLEAAGPTLSKGGSGTVAVTFADGVLTTSQTTATIELPMTFTGTATAPTVLAPAEGCTLLLNAANAGSGAIEVTSGTVAVANAGALASTTTTVKSGATFEARGFAADTALSNTVIFEEGAILSATAAEGVTTVRIAGALQLPADQTTVQYRLNGELYDEVTVDAAAGTVTFVTKVIVADVTWDAAQAEGVWAEGVAGPWVDDETYYNGAAVTFVNATPAKVDVTVQGNVAPASMTWGASSADTYRFNGASNLAMLTLTGETLDMGSGQVYNIPVATAVNANLTGVSNTYRLIGALSNGRKASSLVTATDTMINMNTTQAGVWCTDGVTLAPQAGEVMTLSAMGYAGDTTHTSHLSGSGNVTITGGGKVVFAGRVLETATNTVAYQNKAFSGQIIVQDGSTLDITMTRDRNDSRPRDDQAFFAMPASGNQDAAGAPLWTGDTVGIRVLNGSTFRVSGCRGIFGGWANRNDTNLLASRPLEIGTNATAEFAFSALQQVFPHGFRFTGSGATLLATANMFVSGGTTIEVAGIGDKGDRADPATDTAVDADGNPVNADTYNTLTAGIVAEIASGDTTGLVSWSQASTANDPLILSVGEGSTLNISANLLNTNEGAARSNHTFNKVGMGAVRFMQSIVDTETVINVTEGVLGGTATFTAPGTTVTAAAGTVVEAGLSIPVLNLADEVILAINPTGETLLHAGRLSFTTSGHYTIASILPESEIPEAEGLPPMKVVSWNAMRAADTAVFTLDDALTAKGYGLELRADGLYLMKQVTYVRELDIAEAGTYRVIWDANNAWYRLDDPATLRNYDANEDEAVTALFLLPETFAAENATLPVIQLILTREVSFANVRFAVPVEVEGEMTFKTLPVTVVYEYNLINETMPTADSAVRFTWVPTLVLMRDGNPGLATLQVSVPNGYEYTISNTTVMVYASAAAPALNINFTDGIAGDGSWISSTADPCGVEPFAGVYWNNASTTSGSLSAIDANHSVMTMTALPAGIEADVNGQVATCEVTYAFKQPTSIASRMAGNADATLVSSFLAGNNAAALSETIRIAGNMTNAGTRNGWQVRVAAVPFEAYDLYLVLAGNTDDAVTYPAIRIKVGEGDWRTFSMVNGWAAPAAQASTWQGEGGLVKGEFIDGRNVMHIRVQSAAGSALEIAPWDNGQANAATASSVGLAALQIVRCDDGAMMERLGDGKWSDAGGWRRTLFGGTETGAWIDSTAEAPRYASIPLVQSLTADRVATTPYLALTGSGSMVIKGSDAMISTGALDLTQVDAGASVTFGADIFAEPINVLLAPDVTVCVPETASGTVINRWFWLNDDAGRDVNSSSATIQKKLAGDVVFINPVPFNLQIDDGTLWMAPAQAATISSRVSGAGTFGKKGAGTLSFTGTMHQQNETPIRVSEGTLQIDSILRDLGSGKTFLADGGTLFLNKGGDGDGGNAIASGNILRAENGGRIIAGGSNRLTAALPTIIAEKGTFEATITNGYTHVHCGSIVLHDGGELYIAHNAATAWNAEGLVIHGDLTVERGTGHLKVMNNNQQRNAFVLVENAKLVVNEGATLDAFAPIRCRNVEKVFVKSGTGLWLQRAPMFNNAGGTAHGTAIEVDAGEWCYNIGGAEHTIYYTDATTCPITIKTGAKLSGNVVFPAKAPVVFEEGTTIRNGVSGVLNSKVAFHTVTFNKDMVFEMDLRNTTALSVTNTATFMPGEMTVRLLNMGESFTGEKQLIAWPTTVSVPSTFTSPEAMALDAVLEKRNDGLYLVTSNASYVWANQSGVWSQENGWFYQEAAASYPEIANVADPTTPVARLVASEEDVTLALDKGTADVDGVAWKAQSLVTAVSENRTLILNQGASLLASAYAGLNTVVAWADIWKLGEGEAIFNAPVQFRNAGTGASLNVAAGTLTLTHPLTTTAPATGTSPIEIPAAVEVAKGATLVYDLSATQELLNTINGKYNPLAQSFTGAVSGEGTLRVKGANNALTVTTTTDNDLNLDVQAGTLTLNGDVTQGATRSTRRTIAVAKGATLALASENALGGSTNIEWSLAADATQGAVVTTTADARVRGQVNVIAAAADEQATATLGTLMAQLDGTLRLNVPARTTLVMGGEWTTPEDAAETTALTKVGAGLLTLVDFAANVPVTISAGELRLADGAVQTANYNDGATQPLWTVAPGAVLTLGGGKFSLNEGVLTAQSGAIINGGTKTTEVNAATVLEDRTIFAFGEAGNIAVGGVTFKQTTTVNGVITVNLDALSPAELAGKTSLTLVTFDNGMRSGTGSFQLGGNKLVAWAEEGWTLRDSGSEVILQHFGGDTGYYTWAGDGSAGSTGAGNWANAFWVDSATNTLGDWPTATDVSPSVKLQDTDPLTDEEIPEEARTLDWTLPAQTIASFYAKNSEGVDYKLISSSGSAAFEVSGDFLKAGVGKLTVERPLVLGKDGSLRILGGETEFTGAVSASSGEFKKPITLAGENTLLRFSGTPSRALMGLLEGDGQATLTHSGTGTLTLGDSVDKLKALNVEAGHVRLTADGQYVVVPTMTVAEGATLTYGGTLAGAGAVQMQINADAAQAGTLVWNATTASASDKAPRLAAVPGVAGAAVKVNTFRYNPNAGHLILDPNADVLAPGFKLEMMASDEVTAALWLGAQATAGDALTVSALTGEGVIGVEPIVELVSDDTWSTHRVLTVEPTATSPAEVTAFEGSFMGATTPDNTDIRIGLAVQNPNGGDRTYFRYMGNSTHALLGSLTVGADAAAEVTGTWAGDIAVAANGLLMGNGVIGATDRTISVPKGAIISGATYGKRINANNTFTTEVIPAELTVKGTLSLETGSVINTLIRKNEKGNTWASAITVDNLLLPTVLEDGEEEVKLTVNVDLELGAVVSNIKVLGWTSLNGGQKINGTVKVTSNGQEIPGYFLKKKSDGLYLSRESARFWMILH